MAFLGGTEVQRDNCSGTAETSSGNEIFTVAAQLRRHLLNYSLLKTERAKMMPKGQKASHLFTIPAAVQP